MFGLPKGRILRGHETFSVVLTRGNSVTAGSIRLFYLPVDRTPPPRVGFSVSRTVRLATVRNRIKRCLREAYRLHSPELFGLTRHSLDMVVLYRAKVGRKIDSKSLAKDLLVALKQLEQELS